MIFMAKFIKSMPALTSNDIKTLLTDLSRPENITEEERNLIQEVRKLKKTVGSPIKIQG